MPAPPPSRAKIFALFSCKGGVGTTFLTVQLGRLMAQRWQRSVLVVDWVHPFGDTALMLSSQDPPGHLEALLKQPERLDACLLQSALHWPFPKLALLSAPVAPLGNPADIREGLKPFLEAIRQPFDFILFDCGRHLDATTLAIFQAADTLLPVLQATLPMIRDAKRLLTALRGSGIPSSQFLPVLNRTPVPLSEQVETLEAALGTAIRHRIPDLGSARHELAADPNLLSLVRALTATPSAHPKETPLRRWWKKQWRWNIQHS